ncbi:MAG: transcription antitermination factor NusB [Desulfobacterales bacterium]|nr:transcription antitermination factor NusB [Desulfobacterales bacterium]
MGNRRRSREMAMQALFYMDMSPYDPQQTVKLFCQSFDPAADVLPFLLKLINGVVGCQAVIDATIERFSSNWKIGRMSCVDRNVLRVAVYELIFCRDVPAKVSINEAIDIGKKFGSEESGAFINGILDSIRIAMEKHEIQVGDQPEATETHP